MLAVLASSSSATAHSYSLRSDPTGLWLRDPAGDPLLKLNPRLVLHTRGRRRAIPLAAGSWSSNGRGRTLVLQGGDARAHYRLRVSRLGPKTLEIEVTRRFLRRAEVVSETLEFNLAPGVRPIHITDSYVPLPTFGRAFVGGMGPKAALFVRPGGGVVQWRGGPGVQGALIDNHRRRVVVELDNQQNHPLRAFSRCVRRLRRIFAPSVRLDTSLRMAQEKQHARFAWIVGDGDVPVVERLPAGYKAAIVLTDHADQSSWDKLEAFAFGATGAMSRKELGAKYRGFVNRGLRYTKSVFMLPQGPYSPQFSDGRYRAILKELERRGVEIGLHTISGGADPPAMVAKWLPLFRKAHRGRSWIDHQPYTNCEAISAGGWDPQSPWYLVPLLAQHGFRYVWVVPDIRRGQLDLLRGRRVWRRHPLVYRHSRLRAKGKALVAFRSTLLFPSWRGFVRRFSKKALDQLVEASGIFIGHTYLDTHRSRGRFRRRSLLVASGSGYRLRPRVDAVFVRLAARQSKKEIWVTGIEALGDHLLAAQDVRVRPHKNGGWSLSSHKRIAQLTVRTLRVRLDRKGRLSWVGDGKRVRHGARRWIVDLPADRVTPISGASHGAAILSIEGGG